MKPLAALLVLALLVVAAWAGWRNGVAREQNAALQAKLAALAAETRRVDTVYSTDTVRLWSTIRVVDTLTLTVDHWKHDTIEVVRYVTATQAAIAACRAAVFTCEQRVAFRDSTLRVLEAQVKVRERQVFWNRIRDIAIAIGVWETLKAVATLAAP